MNFVEPNALNRTGLAVGKDHGLADKLSLGSLELTEDRACVLLHGWHDGVRKSGGSFGDGLSLKGAEVVTNARQRYVGWGSPPAIQPPHRNVPTDERLALRNFLPLTSVAAKAGKPVRLTEGRQVSEPPNGQKREQNHAGDGGDRNHIDEVVRGH